MSSLSARVSNLVRGLCFLLLAVPLTAAGQAPQGEGAAGPRLVDRLMAIVDEEPILQSDLDREIEIYRMEREYAGEKVTASPEEIRQEMLQRLIENKLIIAAAKQADMSVDDEAIEKSVEQKIQQFVEHFGSLERLQAELKRSGMTLDDYKTRMRAQLRDQQYMRLVVGRFIRPDVEVMENEVRDYYKEHLAEMPTEPDSLTIAGILISVQPSLEVRKQVQEEVGRIQEALAGGMEFGVAAQQFSKGPAAKRGGRLGTVKKGEMFDPALDAAVFALEPGQVSQPVVSSRGVHILRLDAVEADGRRAISQIFLPITISQEDVDSARQRCEDARQRVLGGEAFSLVASEVSEDPGSARKGGMMGTFALADMSQAFQEGLQDAREGELTEPILTPAGWYTFQVLERRAGHMYTYEELRDNLRQAVESQKIEKALSKYVAGLRDRFFVDLES